MTDPQPNRDDGPLPDGEIDAERLKAITGLRKGAHKKPESGLCVMEAVAYIRRLPHSDSPSCVHPDLISLAQGVNDSMPSNVRNELLLPRVTSFIGTVGGDFRAIVEAAVVTAERHCPDRWATQRARHALNLGRVGSAMDYARQAVVPDGNPRTLKPWMPAVDMIDAMIAAAKGVSV